MYTTLYIQHTQKHISELNILLIFFIKLFTLFIQPKSTKNIFGGELQLKKESKITYSEMGKIPDKIQIEFKADHSYQIAFHIHAYFLFQLIKCL